MRLRRWGVLGGLFGLVLGAGRCGGADTTGMVAPPEVGWGGDAGAADAPAAPGRGRAADVPLPGGGTLGRVAADAGAGEEQAVCPTGGLVGYVCDPAVGTPASGAVVWVDALDCAGQSLHRETVTDDGGLFALDGVPAGLQTLHVQGDGFELAPVVFVVAGETTNVSSETAAGCLVDPEACPVGQIAGQACLDVPSTPAVGATVQVRAVTCTGQTVVRKATTGPDGSFVFDDVPAGPVTVSMRLGPATVSFTAEVLPAQTTLLDAVPEHCMQVVPCPVGTLTGVLCAPDGSAWASGAPVELVGSDCYGAPAGWTVTTDPTGHFVFAGVDAGPYTLQWAIGEAAGSQPVFVSAGQVVSAGVVGAPSCNPSGACGTGAIAGQVCAPSGASLPVATVTVDALGCDGGLVHREVAPAPDGSFLIEDVPAGTVTVRVDAGKFSTQYAVEVQAGVTTDATGLGVQTCLPGDQVAVLVVTGMWDAIETILDGLGIGYDIVDSDASPAEVTSLLASPEALGAYDIVFVDCGPAHDDIVASSPAVAAGLAAYVAQGGALHVSDWASAYVEAAWPELLDLYGDDTDPLAARVGIEGTVEATVADGALATALGKMQVTLQYDLGAWVVLEGAGPDATTYLWGPLDPLDGAPGPLMVGAVPDPGGGRVLMTTFHMVAQPTADMLDILELVVFFL